MPTAPQNHGPHPVPAWPYLAVLVVTILAAFSNTIGVPFLYDDTLAIPENPSIRRLWPLSDLLLPSAQGGVTVGGRPVLNFSFAINHAISGTNVWSYHVFNALVHAGSALLLFGIVRRTLGPGIGGRQASLSRFAPAATPLALAIAALWALHPLITQAVTYTVQRAESLMGFFYLLTLYAFVRSVDGQRRRDERQSGHSRHWIGLSIAACVLGMGTKEVMATAPLLVLLYDRTFVTGSFHSAWQQRRGFYLALAATWVVLGGLVLSTGGNRGGTIGLGTGVPLWAYPLTQFEDVAHYLAVAVWPHPLVFEYGTFWVKRIADVAPYAAMILPLLAGVAVALRHQPAIGFCGAWFFVILAPTSLVPGTIQMIVEHRLYLPLAAVVTVGVITLYTCIGRRAWWWLAIGALGVGGLTYRRNQDYRSHLALWTDTVAKRPGNPRAHDGLGEALEKLGRGDEAIMHRREAVRLRPDEATYHYNLALALAGTGQTDEALRHYRESLQLDPNEARTHNNLAILLGKMGRTGEALRHYAEAVRLKPADALYHYNHGIALIRAGRPAEAAVCFENALRLKSDYPDAHHNLATALVQVDRLTEALPHFAAAVNSQPTDVGYRTALGNALLLAMRPDEALAEFRRVLALQPDAVEALFGTGSALSTLRRVDEAIRHYELVLHHSPDHVNAHFKLANVLFDTGRLPAAVQHYETVVRLSPNDAEAHHNLGVTYARLERWNEAQSAFETALRLKPDYAEAQRNLIQLRTLLGR